MHHHFATTSHRVTFHQNVQKLIGNVTDTQKLGLLLFRNGKWTTQKHQYRRHFQGKDLKSNKICNKQRYIMIMMIDVSALRKNVQ